MKMAHQKEYGTINNASVHHGVKPRGATSIDNSAPQAANRRATSSRNFEGSSTVGSMRKYRGKLKKQNAFKERDVMAKSGLARVANLKIVQGGFRRCSFR